MTTPSSALPHAAHARLPRVSAIGYTALRVIAGLLFAQHGAQKLFGVLGGVGGEPGATAPLVSQLGAAGIVEFFGGLLLALGVFTRLVALIAAAAMAGAYVVAHAPRGTWPIQNTGELSLLYCFVWLAVATMGAGPYSLDAVLRRRHHPEGG
jgi:putative oxidoreductase